MEPWISVSSTRDAARVDGRDGPARFEPALLHGFEGGTRFGVWWLPAEGEPRGTILCVQPLGEERPCARRVIAAQAWRMAARGWVVLVPDLYGCGDSPGEPAEATLDAWRSDLFRCTMLVRQRAEGPNVLWSVRAGALLGVDLSVALDQLLDAHLFWQAPESGRNAVDALAASSGLSTRLLVSLGELRMQPPPTAERGSQPSVAFVEINESTASLGDVSLATRALTDSWLDAGYIAGARAARVSPFWDTASLARPLPEALFETTEDFLESLH